MQFADIHLVYLSLGTNLGDKHQHLRQAIQLIYQQIGKVIRQSSFYETAPWGFSSPNMFVNACVCCQTKLSPQQLLQATQSIEKQMGRATKSANNIYQDRIIDIDILLYDDLTINEHNLKIPHPLMQERDFVMIPLQEIMTKTNDL